MPIQKVTFVFDGRQCGWTESHWYQSADGLHAETMAKAADLGLARAQLLGDECKIKAIRVSTEGVGPDAMLNYVDMKPGTKTGSNGDHINQEDTAQRDVALQIRMEDASHSRHKLIFLRGIWDKVETDQGTYAPDDKWTKFLDAWGGQLVRRQWGWYGSSGRTKVKLLSAVMGATDRTTFTFDDFLFPEAVVGKRVKIRISGVNEGHSIINGVHVVDVLSRIACITHGKQAVGNIVEGGFGSYNTYDFWSYRTYDAQKIVTRETGAPLLESPGRQPKRARA